MEEKILDYIRRLFEQLRTNWPAESHWFCPKRRDDDFINYSNIQDTDAEAEAEGLTSADKDRLIREWKHRQEAAYRLCIVYGLSVEEGSDWQELHHKRMTELLTACDRCVRNYHMGRKGFLKEVAEEYDDDLVAQLSERINKMDFLRIDQGLERAHNLLDGTPDPQKGPKALMKEPRALTALYEALCCSSYHTSAQKLQSAFDHPFKLVQKKKVLRLGDILPASARFLFQPDEHRLRFAKAAWEDLNQSLHQTIFDWSVQDALTDAIISVSQMSPILDVQRFWEGVLLILDKLDKPLITHSVRGMEVQPDLYHLALQHLAHYDSEDVLELIIRALRKLLLKSPEDFWSAYGALSSTTIAEQIINCKAFGRLLASSQHIEVIDGVRTPSALAWISPFVISLPPAQQFDVCRSLLYHLLERFQGDTAQPKSKLFCFQAGLNVLLNTLVTFVDSGYKINASTSYIVVNNILGLVAKYKAVIIDSANLLHGKEESKELSRLGMQVIRNGLSLCCKSMQAEFQALGLKKDIRHELDSYSQPLWQSALDGLRRDNLDMGKNILIGLTPLVGLDKVKVRSVRDSKGSSQPDPLLKSKSRFNKDFDVIIEIVSRVFQRLSDFSPQNLDQLCQHLVTGYPFFASLMPPDQATYEASVEMIKIMTGKSARQAAISKLLRESFTRVLTALSWASRRISKYGTFAGIPYLLKTSHDVLHSLCDPQHGLLRLKTSTAGGEQKALAIWWSEQWEVMGTAFRNYEQWTWGSDHSFMTDVCRDIMEYSDSLFDQYSVLASALDGETLSSYPGLDRSDVSRASRANLLEYPRRATEYLVRWLRLRDTYLLSILVNLLCKILRRLGEFDMGIAENALTTVEMVGFGEDKKYRVTAQQKAELRRAVEEHRGLAETENLAVSKMKQAQKPANRQEKIDGWSRSKNISYSTVGTLNDEVRSLSTSLERGSSTMDLIRARVKKPMISDSKDSMTAQSFKDSREKAKEEKRQRDAKMIAEAKALRAPRSLPPIEIAAAKGHGVKGSIAKGQGVMVSSDSSSDDDGTGIKALINKRIERSKKGTEQEQSLRRALNQQQQIPVKKTKIQRSLNDMRARLVPNMDILHLTILKWDIFVEGDQPPGGIDCEKVSDRFRTALDYYDTFYPLLIAEAWRSLSTAREESNFKPFEINVVNRISVDVFFEVATTMQIADNRDNNISEGDIVLFSKGQDPLRDRQQVSCLSRVYRVNRKKDALEISYRVSGQASVSSGILSALSPNVKIRGVKITSLTTIEREYGALKSLEYYDLCEEILTAQPSPILAYTEQTLNPIRNIYGLNMGQAKAIWSTKQNDAFTLVQGPPGSGKTKTIIAMVGALLTDVLLTTSGTAITQPRGVDTKSSNGVQIPRKLLICAPSNAAVDEIVSRLKEGVMTLKGQFRKINVIRLGRSEAIDANVKDVTLDELVRAKMEGDGKSGKLVISDREKLHQEAGRLKEVLGTLRPKLDEARSAGDSDLERRIQREIDEKKKEQGRIGSKIDDLKANGNTASRENEITRRRLQQEIIDSAHVLCSTLSGSGHDMFKNLSVEFETVIIDEAAQCIELSALIPLKYGCSKCILVGDPKQLPPTVLSKSAARYGYEQSLFVRMQQNHPKDVHLLDTQYRMHPEISNFPRKQFYDGQLVDGENLAHLRQKPWHASPLLGPYRFFDVKGTQTTGARGHSFINIAEITVAIQIYEHLKRTLPQYDFSHKIGIITPYKAQLGELRRSFQRRYGESVIDEIEFNTTDAFQGRESEIIIFSCVRARASGGIGFLNDVRRMNVGLTRAKSSLWVLGDSNSLMQGPFWARLVDDAKSRQRYTEGNVQKLLRGEAPLDNDTSMSTAPAGQSNTPTFSRQSSIESVEMTDAPPIKEERRPSTTSIDTASSSSVMSSKRKRDPSPSDGAAHPLRVPGKPIEMEGPSHRSVKGLEKSSDVQNTSSPTIPGNSHPRPLPIAKKLIMPRKKAADPLMRNRPPPRPSK